MPDAVYNLPVNALILAPSFGKLASFCIIENQSIDIKFMAE